MGQNRDVSLLERFIIMIFGIGVVLAGIYPLTREYGGLGQFFKSKSERAAKIYQDIEDKIGRAQLDDDRKDTKVTKKAIVEKNSDKLSNKDREELDGLIDKVWK